MVQQVQGVPGQSEVEALFPEYYYVAPLAAAKEHFRPLTCFEAQLLLGSRRPAAGETHNPETIPVQV